MIFTGLSNNWALLQRVNAIEKYLSENPIVPYAKASVAGQGTDTYVFDKSQLTTANGADLMVGDLIICPDVTLWQVISIADTGEITARFLVNFKGEKGNTGEQGEPGAQGEPGTQGEPGEQGIPGKDALVYSLTLTINVDTPNMAGVIPTVSAYYNRNPSIGEFCIYVCSSSTSNKTFIIIGKIVSNTVVGINISVESYVETTGKQGEQGEDGTVLTTLDSIAITKADSSNVLQSEKGFQIQFMNGYLEFNGAELSLSTINGTLDIPLKATGGVVADVSEDGKFIELHAELYRHRIKIIEEMSNTISITFDIYNRSATQFSYTALAQYLAGKEYNCSGKFTDQPSMPSPITLNEIAETITANGGTIIIYSAGNVNSIDVPSGITVLDTIEEI